MSQLRFEFKKSQVKYAWLALLLIPIIFLLVVGTYNQQTDDNRQKEEANLANSLLIDLGVQLDQLDMKRGPLFERDYSDSIEDVLTEEELAAYDILMEAEQERFHYSVNVYHGNWNEVNQNKLFIWERILDLFDLGYGFSSISQEEVRADLPVLQWLVDHDIPYVDTEQPTEGLFLVQRWSGILLGLPLMALVVFLFGLPIFEDLKTPKKNFMRVTPVSNGSVMVSKLALFVLIILSYFLAIALAAGVANAAFGSIPLGLQWSYPVSQIMGQDIIVKSLWEVLVFMGLFFMLLSAILLLLVELVDHWVHQKILSFGLVTFTLLIGNMLSQIFQVEAVWNPFTWFNPQAIVTTYPRKDLLLLLGLSFLVLVLLLAAYTRLTENQESSRSLLGQVKPHKKALNLAGFERIKVKRSYLNIYFLLSLVVLLIYGAAANHQDMQVSRNLALSEIYSDYDIVSVNLEENRLQVEDMKNNPEKYDSHELQMLCFLENHLVWVEELESIVHAPTELERRRILTEVEARLLEGEIEYFTDPTAIPSIVPSSDSVFYPNIQINHEVVQWKQAHDVITTVPDGPYYTKFIPDHSDTPRSGEGAPVTSIDINAYTVYLNKVSKERNDLTGLNLLADFFNDYYYLAFAVLALVFFGPLFVREYEGGRTINFMRVQPNSLGQIHRKKQGLALVRTLLFLILILGLFFLAGLLITGEVGHGQYPFVQYIPQTLGESQPEAYIELLGIRQFFKIIPLWQLVLASVLLFVSALVFVLQLTYFYSSFVQSSWKLYSLVLVTLGLGYFLAYQFTGPWVAYTPFFYLNVPDVVRGWTAIDYNLPHLQVGTGIIVNLAYSLVLFLISQALLKRKEA